MFKTEEEKKQIELGKNNQTTGEIGVKQHLVKIRHNQSAHNESNYHDATLARERNTSATEQQSGKF